MIIKGKYGEAKVFATMIDEDTIQATKNILDLPCVEGSEIALMADTHKASDHAVVGFVQKIKDKVLPSLVSSDIACSMTVCELGKVDIDFEKFDKIVHEVNESKDRSDAEFDFSRLTFKCSEKRALESIGTGLGNHFVELDTDDSGIIYLIVHSGSRNLGGQIYKHYQEIAYKKCNSNKEEKLVLIKKLKEEGREKEIQSELEKISKPYVSKELCWLEGKDLEDYIHDCQIAKEFSHYNRMYLINKILEKYGEGLKIISSFDTVHNYIDEEGIVRKGAISAKKDERVYIPINMSYGGILGMSLGNEDYLYSAPHGAGRLMSRKEAKEKISLEEFKESMKGIYSSTVNEDTIDEAPMSYKRIEDILPMLEKTVKVEKIIKPVYNYKEAESCPWLKK